MIYIALTQFRFVKKLKLHVTFNCFALGIQFTRVLTYFSLAEMASEAPPKMEFLLVCG